MEQTYEIISYQNHLVKAALISLSRELRSDFKESIDFFNYGSPVNGWNEVVTVGNFSA